jgi:hypothetical protein
LPPAPPIKEQEEEGVPFISMLDSNFYRNLKKEIKTAYGVLADVPQMY